MTMVDSTLTGAEDVVWNLSDLLDTADDASISALMDAVLNQAQQFADQYRGRVGSLSADQLTVALNTLEEIYETVYRVTAYAQLQWTTDTNNPAFGALLQRFQEFNAALSQRLLFFDLEWAATTDEQAAVANSPTLSRYKHHLENTRKLRPYQLTEPEEKIIAEKEVTGLHAWQRFYQQVLGAAEYEFDGKKVNQELVLRQLYAPDREVRRRAAESITMGLHNHLKPITFIFNVALAEKASDDRLRKFPTWVSARNLSNEASDESVQALVAAVTSRYDIVARYYKIKRRLLGYDELYEYDRYAPLAGKDTEYSWVQARDTVLNAFNAFHPTVGGIAAEFFDKNWIHARVQQGKRGGAFAHPTSPTVHPYIFVNYTGRTRDVMTLAHELGHGVHMYLSRPHGVFGASTPLTTAESASVFGEMMVFNDLMRSETDPQVKISMLAGKIEDTFATVFRQVAMNRFEEAIHLSRRSEGELTTERIGEHWMNTQRAMFTDSLTLRDDYSIWWSYISHFIGSPGYVYAYAFGELLVMALLAEYKKQGSTFAPKYLELLSAGGSDSPQNIVAKVGINLNDPNFWHQGLSMIDDMVTQLDDLVKSTAS